jgi:YVTN family beta-propeller protein
MTPLRAWFAAVVLAGGAAACGNNPAQVQQTQPPQSTHPKGIIAESLAVSARPFGVAVSPQGVVYVTRLDASALAVADAARLALKGSVVVGSTPTGVAFDPGGATAYVANQLSDNIGVVPAGSAIQTRAIAVHGDPFNVIVSPDGTRLFASTNADSVFELDPATGRELAAVATPGTPSAFVFDPSGSVLYTNVVNGGVVEAIDVSTMQIAHTLVTGGVPQGLAFSPDGTELYVANEAGWLGIWHVAGTPTQVDSIALPAGGFGLALTPDGAQLYVTLPSAGAVAILDRTTRALVNGIVTGGMPRRVAFTSDGRTAAIANEYGYLTFIR